MKATITLLTALVISTITFSTARAQYPLQPIEQTGFGKATTGGCSDCDGGKGKLFGHHGGGGCADGSCGKTGFLGHLGLGKGDCGKGGCGAGGCGQKCCLMKWLCRPLPSNAPSCCRPDYPLGFPQHPYLRSPRDYFMMD
jgi:hypothetical protein